ncbi:histidine kinase [Sphaerisporangium sp. TRM90804]|uniref:sensor histidine kinase n=1 Tax=Sphaerisporangium sp. TRM90804 TaxID=3031113 RepID=UPI00244CB8B1|nr:histidine kinase [Sphaerisporangium sp. TRM90804]MDH2426572.1 histidine kinase [Sphaerisporangium sp. TRM90804]
MRSVRAGVVDAGIGAAVTTVTAVAVAADIGGGAPPPPGAYLFALCFGALMAVRRRFPVLVLLATALGLMAYYAARFPPIGLAIPLSGALYSAAEAGRVRWAAGVAGMMITVSSVFRFRDGDDPSFLFGLELTSAVALMVAMIALGDGLRARRLLRAEMRRREERAAAEREQEAARRTEEERMRIARELHDVLAHTVTVISVQASVAAEALPADPPAAGAALEVIRQAGADAMKELRATLGLLRHGEAGRPSLAPVGGLSDLERLARTMGGSGLPVTVTVLGEPVALPHVVDSTAYRVVQEALTNTLRHAGATTAEVVLTYGADLRITVNDDGRGGAVDRDDGPGGGVNGTGDAAPEAGYGLRGMAERVALLGGGVWAGNGSSGGFRVDVVLPLAVQRSAMHGDAPMTAPVGAVTGRSGTARPNGALTGEGGAAR